jgi:hypothetical protein
MFRIFSSFGEIRGKFVLENAKQKAVMEKLSRAYIELIVRGVIRWISL